MSNIVTAMCRPLRLTPTQKATLMCLADYCHDDGRDWHSIAAIMDWTCLGKTAVIESLKALESAGLIEVDRRIGTRNTTFLKLDRISTATPNQSAGRTSPPDEPVRVADLTSPRGEPPPVRVADKPVRVADPKHQEASVKHQKHQQQPARKRASAKVSHFVPDGDIPEGIPIEAWRSFTAMRDERRKPMSMEAQRLMFGRLQRMKTEGVNVLDAIEASIRNGWTDVYAPNHRDGGRTRAGKQTGFATMNYREGVNGDGSFA